MPSTLYLIDGHALAYRAYYALTSGGTASERWLTSKGEPTAGVYGFTSVLLRLLEQERPDYLAVVFDKGKSFRDDIYPDYKATREKMPEDLRPQIDRMRELVDSFNIPRAEREGYEADDVLGSLARWAADQGLHVKIITGDKDLLQLVNDQIVVNLPGRSLSDARDYFKENVKEKLGVWPEQVVDFKALTGDRSDNIPGVYGVGEKTAVALLEKYHTLGGIYDHLEEIKTRFKNKLAEGKEDAFLSQKLARIVEDLPIVLDLDKARPERFDPQRVRSLFRDLEFKSLLSRLETVEGLYGKEVGGLQMTFLETEDEGDADVLIDRETSDSSVKVEIITKVEQLRMAAEKLNEAELIALDTETTSSDQMEADLVGISLASDPHHGYYIPIGHRETSDRQISLDQAVESLQGPLTDPTIPKVGHNLKFDAVILKRVGLDVTPLGFDTMIAEWLINPASRNLGLKKLAWVRLNRTMTEIKDLIGTGRDQITMAGVAVEEAAPYAVDDAVVLLELIPLLEKDLEDHQARKLFTELEMPLVPVLMDMEMQGIRLDRQFLEEMSDRLEKQLDELEGKIYREVGREFNLNSPKQLSGALFDDLELSPPDRTNRTASGYFSTAADVLEAMADDHRVPSWVLEYREFAKLKSTYVDALQEQINPETNRVHTSYNQTGSVTGRLASSDPNLQNIPIRTEIGREVRKAFIPTEGWTLIAVDYSQIELRVVAHMAGDQAMLNAFAAGQDIHAATAAAIYNIPIDQVDSTQRRKAKAINFGLIYGMSPYGLTQTTDLTLAEAEGFWEAYFEQFPGIKSFLEDIKEQAVKTGYVETLLGRRRYFPQLSSGANFNVRRREEREAINAPIQGTAADIMKQAMLDVREALESAGLSARMLLQVHDELVLEAPEAEVDSTIELVQRTMEAAYPLDIPLTTDASQGKNWGSLTKYERAVQKEEQDRVSHE